MKARARLQPFVTMMEVDKLRPDTTNPRKNEAGRMAMLQLSIRKLGFIMPVFVEARTGLLLSGHQRLTVAKSLGIARIPGMAVTVDAADVKGINILFNRVTNDFTAFDTGKKAQGKLSMTTVMDSAEELDDADHESPLAIDCRSEDLRSIGAALADRYDKKAVSQALAMSRLGIRIPVVITESGEVVNGIHRIFAALEAGTPQWPVIRIPDAQGHVALNFLNYLSMDFHVDEDFKNLIRASQYRRPQNNRGVLPKAYRFWANGHRTLADRDSYSTDYWRQFRDRHGATVLDFGAGLGKVAPYLRGKGFEALDFEPYRIDPDTDVGTPSPGYSRKMARGFLKAISDPSLRFDSIFLASVLNSVPFALDRMCVLAIVHALSHKRTRTYGTCRDISDFNYEYGGIRNANYFEFDTEPGVRVGDVMRNPKLQKFESQESARAMFARLWNSMEFWPGGNVFYWEIGEPKGVNSIVLSKALELEFDLPFADGTRMGLVDEAKAAFSKRLNLTLE